MKTNEKDGPLKDKNIDPVGARVQENDYPVLNLFKIVNGLLVLMIWAFVGFGGFSFYLSTVSLLAIVLGMVSLFIPATTTGAKKFKVVSFGMYIGVAVLYIAT